MKTFKEYLQEHPLNDYFNNKDSFSTASKHNHELIKGHHNKATHLGDSNYHNNISTRHYYYHMHGSSPREHCEISNDNVQDYVDKCGGDVKHIHKFMIHHVNNHGVLKSSETNTPGAKNLWTSLIKSNPKDKSFHIVNDDKSEYVNNHDIDKKSHKIWGDLESHRNTHLEMRNK